MGHVVLHIPDPPSSYKFTSKVRSEGLGLRLNKHHLPLIFDLWSLHEDFSRKRACMQHFNMTSGDGRMLVCPNPSKAKTWS